MNFEGAAIISIVSSLDYQENNPLHDFSKNLSKASHASQIKCKKSEKRAIHAKITPTPGRICIIRLKISSKTQDACSHTNLLPAEREIRAFWSQGARN
jgi:hypothetical protein